MGPFDTPFTVGALENASYYNKDFEGNYLQIVILFLIVLIAKILKRFCLQ